MLKDAGYIEKEDKNPLEEEVEQFVPVDLQPTEDIAPDLEEPSVETSPVEVEKSELEEEEE